MIWRGERGIKRWESGQKGTGMVRQTSLLWVKMGSALNQEGQSSLLYRLPGAPQVEPHQSFPVKIQEEQAFVDQPGN